MKGKSAPRRVQQWLTPEALTKLEGWARLGLTYEQIAHNCGIHLNSLLNWRKKYPEIEEALRKGAEVVDFEVERALLKTALGYEYTEQFVNSDGKKTATKKHMPGNVAAQIFWLKNRKPDKWSDRQQMEVKDITPVVIKDDLSEED